MNLTEQQGKLLFERHAVPIPREWRWPVPEVLKQPLVVKSQILEGGRGKRGGVRVVHSAEELHAAADEMLAGTALLPPALGVLVEEHLDLRKEYYLAVVVDREQRAPVLLAHPVGGVDIETRDPAEFLRRRIGRHAGVTAADVEAVADHLRIERALRSQLHQFVEALWRVFVLEDCTVVEVNPLGVTTDHRLIAVDSKVVVDDAAYWRHEGWVASLEGTPFETAVARAGAVATELAGEVAIVTSGAGLGMATLDLVVAAGSQPACLVDLAGSVFRGSDGIAEVFEAIGSLGAHTLLVSAFFQAAPSDDVAIGYLKASAALQGWRVVMRLRGNRADAARSLLTGQGVFVTQNLRTAIAAATATTTRNARPS